MADQRSPGAKRIQAKRATTTVKAIRRKQAEGTATGNERASVRVGKSSTKILTGAEDLSEWDDEELIRGMRRDRNGGWRGKKPLVVPKAIHDELVKRTLSRAQHELAGSLEKAVEVLVALVVNENVEPRDRLRAISMVMDRVMGKEPIKMESSGDAPWLVALQGAIVNVEDAAPEQEDDDDGEG